jgi:hypothetical protein
MIPATAITGRFFREDERSNSSNLNSYILERIMMMSDE